MLATGRPAGPSDQPEMEEYLQGACFPLPCSIGLLLAVTVSYLGTTHLKGSALWPLLSARGLRADGSVHDFKLFQLIVSCLLAL